MMETKENILQKKLDVISKGNTTEIQFCYDAIFEAMEEYAKQQINLSLGDVSDSVAFADWINKNDYEKIHGDRWCKKYMSFTHSTQELYEMWSETER